MKKVIIGLSLVASLCSAQATNLVHMSTTTDSQTGSRGNMYLDYNSFLYTDNTRTIRNAWVKAMYDNGSYKFDRFETHCPSRMYRITSTHEYVQHNSTPRSSDFSSSQWNYTIPGSVAENMVNIICTSPVR